MQALWMLAAMFMFALMGATVKLAGDMQATLPQIIIMRSLPSIIMLLFWARLGRQSLKPVVWQLHIWRNLAGAGALWTGFYATTHLPLATAITLNYTTPLFVAAWLLTLGGNQRDWVRGLSVGAGFMGVLAVLRPTLNPSDWLPAMLGLTAAGLGAIAQMQLRALGRIGEPAWRTVFYFSVTGFLTGLIGLVPLGWTAPSARGWAALIALGITGLLGQLALTRAFGKGSALLSAALQYSIILFASVFGFLIWGDVPDRTAVLGMVLIVAACVVSVWHTAHREP